MFCHSLSLPLRPLHISSLSLPLTPLSSLHIASLSLSLFHSASLHYSALFLLRFCFQTPLFTPPHCLCISGFTFGLFFCWEAETGTSHYLSSVLCVTLGRRVYVCETGMNYENEKVFFFKGKSGSAVLMCHQHDAGFPPWNISLWNRSRVDKRLKEIGNPDSHHVWGFWSHGRLSVSSAWLNTERCDWLSPPLCRMEREQHTHAAAETWSRHSWWHTQLVVRSLSTNI